MNIKARAKTQMSGCETGTPAYTHTHAYTRTHTYTHVRAHIRKVHRMHYPHGYHTCFCASPSAFHIALTNLDCSPKVPVSLPSFCNSDRNKLNADSGFLLQTEIRTSGGRKPWHTFSPRWPCALRDMLLIRVDIALSLLRFHIGLALREKEHSTAHPKSSSIL